MKRIEFASAFGIGLLVQAWIAAGLMGHSWLGLCMTLVIVAVYLLGAVELSRFRAATDGLARALVELPQPMVELTPWLEGLPASLRASVRQRVEGERVGLPGPALTPYLVGLLVMLGMLGTFLGMIVTFKGAVFALEGSADLQAIRGALAAPIKGLGLSFGTSVSGVAASAMLGLMSALSRRERSRAVAKLDHLIATDLRGFALAHQRQEVLRALQQQSAALPDVAERLQALMAQIERRHEHLNDQLQTRQEQFHLDMTKAYTALATQVGTALQDSLISGARAAGESIRPVLESAMSDMAQESSRWHERMRQSVQAQWVGMATEFQAGAQLAANAWTDAQKAQAESDERLLARLELMQSEAEQSRLQTWSQSLDSLSARMQQAWQLAGEQSMQRQKSVFEALEKSVGEISAQSVEKAALALDGATQLLARAETWMEMRLKTEADWTRQHGERMDQLAALWRQELAALRVEEGVRGQAAVKRLADLQEAMSKQLATLGAALEDPMTRLMQTAAEVPQAAAGVISSLKQELSRLQERDNLALEERTLLLERMGGLLQSVEQSTARQHEAIQGMMAAANAAMNQAVSAFAQTMGQESSKAVDVSAQLQASAIELSSLGSAFEHAVGLFSASNDKLVTGLQHVEGAVTQSMARSDEQLAYYVAQAREVIDLSISSQRGIVEDLRRLRDEQSGKAVAVN